MADPPGEAGWSLLNVIDSATSSDPLRTVCRVGTPRIGSDQRRARLVRRHRLAADARTDDAVRLVDDLVALHSTDPVTVHLSALARGVHSLEPALYEHRSLVRVLGMRRTLFVVPTDAAPLVLAGCTRAISVVERRRTAKFLLESGITAEPESWLAAAEQQTLAAMAGRGEVLTNDLTRELPVLAEQIVLSRGKRYEGRQSVGGRVLPLLAAAGHVVRARPRGTWVSGQYSWSLTREWLGRDFPHLDVESSRVELARRWLRAFGPAPVSDLKWWTGWTLGQTRAALAALGVVAVDLDGRPGVALDDDLEPVAQPEPSAALLPSLDPTVMGWADREWFLGPHAQPLFDGFGNAGPTAWWDGRVVGGWAQRRDGEIVVRLLDDAGSEAAAALEAEAARLQQWLGDSRFTPRFPTPLERKLVG